MADFIGTNVTAMDEWVTTMKKIDEDYDTKINELYSTIDSLVQSDFTGGLAESFHESVMSKKDDFTRLYEAINEFADSMNNTSNQVSEDTDYLQSKIQNNSMF